MSAVVRQLVLGHHTVQHNGHLGTGGKAALVGLEWGIEVKKKGERVESVESFNLSKWQLFVCGMQRIIL